MFPFRFCLSDESETAIDYIHVGNSYAACLLSACKCHFVQSAHAIGLIPISIVKKQGERLGILVQNAIETGSELQH